MRQRTIKYPITIEGIGLHSGKMNSIRLCPATENTGIVFGNPYSFIIEYTPENIIDTMMSTVIGNKNYKISTIEHLMSALHACQITNLYVQVLEIDCYSRDETCEVPILDGSAYNFYHLIKTAEIEIQDEDVKIKKVIKQFSISDDNSYISVIPYNEFNVCYYLETEYSKNFIADFKLEDFQKIYRAKTFGKYEDFAKLRVKGLIKGGSTDSAIVYSDKGIINEYAMHSRTDDFIHHKLMDFIGDIYSLGIVQGYFIVKNTSHILNNKFCREFMKNKEIWTEV